MLTDKAKIDFEKWVNETYYPSSSLMSIRATLANEIKTSYFAMVIEWLDTAGIVIMTNKAYIPPFWWQFTIQNKHNSPYSFASRNEAVQAAIIKANELYNLKHQ